MLFVYMIKQKNEININNITKVVLNCAIFTICNLLILLVFLFNLVCVSVKVLTFIMLLYLSYYFI